MKKGGLALSDRGMISPSQLSIVFIISRTVPPVVVLPSIAIAGKGAWMSVLLATVLAVPIMYVMISLAKRFPDQTLVDYTQTVLGKPLGKVIALYYVWFFLHIAAFNLRQLGDVMSSLIPETPLMVFIATTLFVAMLMARGGVEVMGRFAEMTIPVLSVLISLSLLLITPKVNVANLFPLMPEGPGPIIGGGLIELILFSELLPLGMIFPYINRRRQVSKYMLAYLFTSGFTIACLGVVAAGVFGSLLADIRFPAYNVVRYIRVGQFLERLEGIALAIWVLGFVVKVGLFLYSASLGLTQALGLREHKPFVPSLALFVALLAVVLGENIFELGSFFTPGVAPPYGLFAELFLPGVTLAVAAMRGFRPQPIPRGDERV